MKRVKSLNEVFINALKGNIPSTLKRALETKTPEQVQEIIANMYKEYPIMMKEFLRILNQMYIVFALKQNDYGPGNIALGTQLKNQNEINAARKAVLVRTQDKINRMVNLDLLKNTEPANESLADSWEDTGVYSVIAQLVIRGVWGK